MKGIKVSDFIRPVSLNDEYPTHIDTFGQGGLHSVNTLEERNNIPKQRRKEGMLVFVRENGRFFYLLNGIANSNWTELTEVIYTGFRLLENYILIGNEIGLAYQSPLLMYLKNDLLKLKKDVDDLNYLDYGAINLGNKYNLPAPTKLGAAVFPLPDISSLGISFINNIPIPNPTFNPVSLGDWIMSGPWLPQIFAGSIDADLSNPLTTVSSSLAMTQIRTAKNFKLFDNANFIVASKNVSFLWDNPAYIIESIDPKLKAIFELYDLGTTYTFTKAQSLGDLETGLLKNTVNNATGTLSKAVSGEDYVNTANIPTGSLVILDPLYPLIGHKLIAPVTFNVRRNTDDEFSKPINTIDVLDGTAAKLENLSVTSIDNNSIVKTNNKGELVKAVPDTDYTTPTSLNDVINTLSATASVVKNIIGVSTSVDIKAVTSTQATALTSAVKNMVGIGQAAEITELTAEAADIITNKSALLEIEAQIAALAGVAEINTLWNLFNTVLGVGVAVGGYHYGQFIRGQTLNVNSNWYSTDLNDECSNATGKIRALTYTPYTYENRGYGTLWFDSCHRDPSSIFSDTRNKAKSEAGLRLFSWDSTNDITDITNNPLSPLHIGLFGYRKYYTQADEYKGFIFNVEFDNDQGSIIPGNITNENYRFPLNFGLYSAKRTVSSLTGTTYGWDYKNPIFKYDYKNFTFYEKVVLKEYTNFEKEADFQKNVRFLGTGAVKIPVGNIFERPSPSEVGMLRYNTEL